MSLWAMSLYGAVMIIAIVILRALLINQLPKKTFLNRLMHILLSVWRNKKVVLCRFVTILVKMQSKKG